MGSRKGTTRAAGKKRPAKKVAAKATAKKPAVKKKPASKRPTTKRAPPKKAAEVAGDVRDGGPRVRMAIAKMLHGPGRIASLLALEKARRGIPADDLLFVGMHNVAQTTWCSMQAVLKSRQNEGMFFHAYLTDRIQHALDAKLVTEPPKDDTELLSVGMDLTLAMVEALDRQREERHRLLGLRLGVERVEDVGPAPSPTDHLAQGRYLEGVHAEKHPTTRWNFAWDNYVIVGVPDGLRSDFVYEFKTTGKRFYLPSTKDQAFTQADLYGTFFGRATKRVQIMVREDGAIVSWDAPVDKANAERALRLLDSVHRGRVLPELPPPWKCRVCELKDTCPLLPKPDG